MEKANEVKKEGGNEGPEGRTEERKGRKGGFGGGRKLGMK